jgi:flagellar export protein FliJ
LAGRFEFRLEAVLRVRRLERDRERRHVAEQQRKVQSLKEAIQQLGLEMRLNVEEARVSQDRADLDLSSVRAHRYVDARLHRQVLETQAALDEAEEELARRRAALAEASSRCKAIEKLRERQEARHKLELRRTEQAETDEQAGQQYVRRQVRSPQREAAEEVHG